MSKSNPIVLTPTTDNLGCAIFKDANGQRWEEYTVDRGVPEDPIECECGRTVYYGFRSEWNEECCPSCVEIEDAILADNTYGDAIQGNDEE